MIILYGVAFLIVIYLIIRQFYSVQYTPGVTVLYDTPVTQRLFPDATKKLFPTWGYDEIGRVKSDPTKYGQGEFWPESGKGYEPTASGSGGPDPSGGMRSARLPTHWELREGYDPLPTVRNIYDSHADIPRPTTTDIGWWGYQ